MHFNQGEKTSFFQILILFLSIYVIGSLCVTTFWELRPEEEKLIHYIDYLICAIFFIDFIRSYRNAKNKLEYMKWGWIDLISCIPMIDYLRVGRMMRIIKIIRILRAFRSIRILYQYIFRKKTQGAFSSAAILAVLMIIFSSISVLHVEDQPNCNIKTAEDALWWSYCTITTVGFGDRYPITTEGRFVAILLMTTGVGLFGTFTGYIASLFISDNLEGENLDDRIIDPKND
jgi:voltage-gated potassium channel